MNPQNQSKHLTPPRINSMTSKVRACFQNTSRSLFSNNKNEVMKTSSLSFSMLASVGAGLLASSGGAYASCDNYAPTSGQTVSCVAGGTFSQINAVAGATNVTVDVAANTIINSMPMSLGADAVLNNHGAITSVSSALSMATNATVHNYQDGVISARISGILLSNGGSIINDGSIQAGVNYTSGSTGSGVSLQEGGTLTNTATGTIVNTAAQGVNLYSTSTARTSQVYNEGLIEGTASGIYSHPAMVGLGTVVNSGIIRATNATNSYGAALNAKSILINQAGGLVTGFTGVSAGKGSTIDNSGTITGTGGTAVTFSTTGNKLIMRSGAVLNGSAISSVLTGNSIDFYDSGTSASTISNFESLTMQGVDWKLSGPITISGAAADATHVMAGNLTLDNNLNHSNSTGGVTIDSGAQLTFTGSTAAQTGQTDANIVNNGALSLSHTGTANPWVYTKVISGAGNLIQTGTGSFNLDGAAASASFVDAAFTGGAFTVSGGAKLYTATSVVANGGNVVVGNSGSLWGASSSIIVGANTGSGSLLITGTAKATAAGTGMILGADAGSAGTLSITNGTLETTKLTKGAGAGTINLSQDGTIRALAADAAFFSGFSSNGATADISFVTSGIIDSNGFDIGGDAALSGAGSFTKMGAGKLTLSGTDSRVDSVTVSAGALALTQVGVFKSTTDYTTASGATTDLSSTSTLQVGSTFTQASGSILNIALGSVQPIISASSASLNGTLNISGFGTSAPNSASALAGTQFNIIHTAGTNGITGDFSSVNLGGATNSLDYLQLSAGKSANSQDYNVGFGLTWLAGTAKGNGTFTLTNASDIFDVDVVLADQTAPFTSGWDGKTLTKEGAGTLTLSSANTYTGSTIINAGTLKTNAVDVFATGGSITNVSVASGATLDLNGFNQITNNLTGAGNIKLGSATLSAVNYVDSAFSGSIEGSGSLTKAQSGILTLSGNNTYSGGTLVSGGWIAATNGNAMGTGTVTNNSAIELAFATDSALANVLVGTGLLTKTQQGIATLSSVGSSMGNIDVMSGTLKFAQDGAFAVSNNYLNLNGATTSMNADSTLVVGNQFKMNGELNIIAGNTQPVISADTVDLGATSTLNISGYSALSSASASELANNVYQVIQTTAADHLTGQFNNVTIGGSSSPVDYLTLTGSVDSAKQNYDIGLKLTWYAAHTASPANANGTFTLSNAANQFDMDVVLADEVANATTGWNGKSLTKAGDGTLILSKANTYSGKTQIEGGTLQMGVANAIALSSDVNVSDGSTLDLNSFNQTLNNLSGAGQITLGSATLSAYNNTVEDSTFSGQISGSGALVKEGANTLILSGDNLYTGSTTINAGALQLGDGGVSGSVLGDIVDNGTLIFNHSNDLVYSSVISGSGAVIKNGSNTLVLTNDDAYLGGTTINTGALQIGNGGTSGSITGDVSNNATLIFNRSDDIQYDHIVSGTGSLTKEGDGALTFNTAQTYTGTTNVNHGTLIIGDDSHSSAYLASSQVNIVSGATLGGYGSVAGNVDNQGTLAVADALAQFSGRAAGAFIVGGDLTNSGHIVMASVVPDSRLIVQGNYIGNNGLITLSTVLGNDASATDKVEILGDSSGHTNVKINNANGQGAQTTNGIEIITVGGQSNGTFSLSERVVAGVYEYSLLKNNSNGDWYLSSLKEGGDGDKWRPEVGAYLGNQALTGLLQQHTFYDRQSSVQGSNNGSGWIRVATGVVDSKAGNGQIDQDSDYSLVHFGSDVGLLDLDEGRLHLGVMGSWGTAHTDSSAEGNSNKAKGDVDGYSLGVYATWLAQKDALDGLYVDGWAQYGWYNNKVQVQQLSDEKYDSNAWTASLEAGYSFLISGNESSSLILTPQAQIIYSHYQADDYTEQNGSRITDQNGNTIMTRLGARLSGKTTYNGREIQPFMEMNWWHNNQDNSISFDGQTAREDTPKDRAEFKVGIQGELAKNWSGWLNLGVQTGSNNYSSVEGYAGVKYSF